MKEKREGDGEGGGEKGGKGQENGNISQQKDTFEEIDRQESAPRRIRPPSPPPSPSTSINEINQTKFLIAYSIDSH